MEKLEIKDFDIKKLEFVGELFNIYWRNDHIFYRNPDMLHWYCYRNPYAALFSEGLTVKGAYLDKTLVGFFAYFPFLLNNFGSRHYGFKTAQWFSFPEYRGKSIGLNLLKKAWNNNFEICFALGNNEGARNIFKKWDWNFIELWPRYVLLLDKDRCNNIIGDNDKIRNYVDKHPGFERKQKSRESFDIEEPLTLNNIEWDNFYWNEIAPASIGPAREKKYLQWRYEDIPLFKYDFITAYKNNSIKGLLVYRNQKIPNTQENIITILELISTTQCSDLLIDRLIDIALKENCAFIDFYCTTPRYKNTMTKKGFILDKVDNHYTLPYLFRPVDTETLTFDLAWKTSGTGWEKPQNWENLYLTKGDGFLDVPN